MPDFTTAWPLLAATAALAYLLGSISFGILVARAFGLGDLRQIGSGNIGATNVLRTGNRAAAALTLVLDAAKGAVAVILARLLAGEDAAQVAGLAAFLGHCFPVWLKFRGGKGVATFLGTLLALYWPLGLLCCATWLVIAAATRYSSAAALLAAAMSPVYAVVMGRSLYLVLVTLLTVVVWIRHRANLKRLKNGTETRIGQKS